MLKLVLAAAGCAALLGTPFASADEQELEAFDNGQIEFITPSGNVGCLYTPEGGTDVYEPIDGGPELSCDRIEPDYVNVRLGPAGEAERTDDPGEQACCGATNVVAYDAEIVLDGFICYAETTGLFCETEDGTHGFILSKAKIVTY